MKETADQQYIKKETALLIALVALVIGFLGGVVFGAFKFTTADPIADSHTAEPAQNEALTHAKAEALKNPGSFTAWVNLGNLYFDLGQGKDAIEAYQKALAIQPDNADVLTDLGVMYRRNGNPEKAIESFDKAIALDPKHELSRFNKGVVLLHDLNRKEEAINVWKELIGINPMAMAPNGLSVDELIRKVNSM
ncbi:MAG: tetratricopeptide repeat protein [Pseudomonadota bacterium]